LVFAARNAAPPATCERESVTARLEQAVDAYRAALEEWTRERLPLDWAGTQINVGVALETLGERGERNCVAGGSDSRQWRVGKFHCGGSHGYEGLCRANLVAAQRPGPSYSKRCRGDDERAGLAGSNGTPAWYA
jgi:hypothetical protein